MVQIWWSPFPALVTSVREILRGQSTPLTRLLHYHKLNYPHQSSGPSSRTNPRATVQSQDPSFSSGKAVHTHTHTHGLKQETLTLRSALCSLKPFGHKHTLLFFFISLLEGGDSECRGGYGFQIKKKKEEKDWQIKHDVVKRRMQLWEWCELLWTEEQRVEDGGGPVTAPPG